MRKNYCSTVAAFDLTVHSSILFHEHIWNKRVIYNSNWTTYPWRIHRVLQTFGAHFTFAANLFERNFSYYGDSLLQRVTEHMKERKTTIRERNFTLQLDILKKLMLNWRICLTDEQLKTWALKLFYKKAIFLVF